MPINPAASSGVRYAATGVAPVSPVPENRLRECQTGTIRVSGCLKIKSRQFSCSRARHLGQARQNQNDLGRGGLVQRG